MAERAVLDGKQLKFGFECLVLTGFAGVVLLRENALARRNAGREVAATLSAVDVAAGLVLKLLTTR